MDEFFKVTVYGQISGYGQAVADPFIRKSKQQATAQPWLNPFDESTKKNRLLPPNGAVAHRDTVFF